MIKVILIFCQFAYPTVFSHYRLVVQAYGNVSMTDEEAEEMIMSADGDGNGEVIIELSCLVLIYVIIDKKSDNQS